jgi:hypothetical protein
MAKADDEFANMIRNLEEKTGKSLDQWVSIARSSGAQKHGEIVKHLKDNGLTHGYANLVAHSTLQSAAVHADGEDLIAAQYGGAKAALRPLYDELTKEIVAFGSDVELSPKKGYVSVRRKKQFAILQPSTATRLDVGINLKGTPPSRRLEASGSFNAMVSHRVRVSDAKEIDRELVGWLRDAYEAAG